MNRQNEQDSATGRNPESKRKQLSRASKQKTSGPENSKALADEPSKKSPTPTPKRTEKSSSESEPADGSVTTQGKKSKHPMPVPKLILEGNRQRQALERLGITNKQLVSVPQISPTIKSCVKGGFKTALEAMRSSSDDQDLAKFLRKYDSIPIGDRNYLSWEAIAIAARVNTKHLMGSLLLAVSQHCATKSKFIVASNHPMITKKRVEFAQMIGGEKDRSALDIMAGAQQSQSGHTFIGKAWFGGSGAGGNKPSKDEDEPTKVTAIYEDSTSGFDDLFPSPNETQDKLVPIRQRLLEG
jgi:hypothetical protein